MSTSKMRWVVTEDHISDIEPVQTGAGNFPLENAIQLPYEFKLLDDDGHLYYSGRCDNPNNFDESEAFAPLRWGTHHAGATEMRIRPGTDHNWETL